MVIAEVNDQMPRTLGDTFLHVSRISAMVETSRPLLELRPEPPTAVQERVARNVASLIPDGATLQMGIGGIPNAVLACLGDHRDLGIHSEMCPDGVVPLMESGVINGARKTLHPGKAVAGFVLGTQGAVRFSPPESGVRIPPHAIRQRSVRHRAERPHDGDQFGATGGSHGAGLLGFDRDAAV